MEIEWRAYMPAMPCECHCSMCISPSSPFVKIKTRIVDVKTMICSALAVLLGGKCKYVSTTHNNYVL